MHFLSEYGLFLAKSITIVIAILIIIAAATAASQKNRTNDEPELKIKKLNKYYQDLANAMKKMILSKSDYKRELKQQKQAAKLENKSPQAHQRLFVIDFKGDIKASAVKSLREEITAILAIARPSDKVLLRLESGGGVMHTYGLAASQLMRIKQKQIPLIVCIDKVAASGGYLMACVADQILAAPFAIIGSIGVLAQIPNVHRFLKKHDIEVEEITAGEYKRTLSIFGENNSKSRKKFKEKLVEAHDLFKSFVKEHRPEVNLDEVATGDYWFAKQANQFNLIDDIATSDDYLLQTSNDADIFYIEMKKKPSWTQKIVKQTQSTIDSLRSESLDNEYFL